MAQQESNRFALFADRDEDSSASTPSLKLSRNPFLNQVVDDSTPWQEVKKRGGKTRPVSDASKPHGNTMASRIDTAPVLPRDRARPRAVSSSTENSHMDRSTDAYENWCGVCNVKLANKTLLLNHIKQLPYHQNYCNFCQRVFKDRNGLKNHLENSYGHDVFCNICLSAFKDRWGLKNHFENNYIAGHDSVCLICLLGFKNKIELERHLQTAEKHIWCHTCRRKFPNQQDRDKHWMSTIKHRHCLQPGCDFDAPNQDTLEKHLANDHFQCECCKEILPSQNKLNAHHGKCGFETSCQHCGETLAGKSELEHHLATVLHCPDCGFFTSHEGNYKTHRTKHIAASMPCWGCKAPLRTLFSMINHLESGSCPSLPDPKQIMGCLGRWWYSTLYMDIDVHAQIRTGRVDLAILHEYTQSGSIHPFVCRAIGCGKTFGQLSGLVQHVESRACAWGIDRVCPPSLEKLLVAECLWKDKAV